MDEDKKQKVLIGVVVGCIVLAGIITFATNRGSGRGRGSTGPLTMLCINNECNADFELSMDEMREQMSGFNEMLMDNPIFICTECNKRSAYRAIICEECDTMFVPIQSNDFRDRCPDCGYSKTEERRKAAK